MNNHILRQMVLTTGFSIAGIAATQAQLSEIPSARSAVGNAGVARLDLFFSEPLVPRVAAEELFSATAVSAPGIALAGEAETAVQPVDDSRITFKILLEKEPLPFEGNALLGNQSGAEADLSSRSIPIATGEERLREENVEILPIPEASSLGMAATGLVLGAIALGSAALLNWRIRRAA